MNNYSQFKNWWHFPTNRFGKSWDIFQHKIQVINLNHNKDENDNDWEQGRRENWLLIESSFDINSLNMLDDYDEAIESFCTRCCMYLSCHTLRTAFVFVFNVWILFHSPSFTETVMVMVVDDRDLPITHSQYYLQLHTAPSSISHNAPFETEMCTCEHISVAKWCIVEYLSNALWD